MTDATQEPEASCQTGAIAECIANLNDIVWGIPMLGLLLLTGLYLMLGLKFMPVTKIGYAFGELFRKRPGGGPGDVSPFAALMTALSATIGTGNIAGVAAAIAIGGPGALFWMWITAIVGTATKYAEGVLAVKYRQISPDGRRLGGPMYYIRHGLGAKWAWLGATFAFFGVFASWGTGAYIQSNSIADVLRSTFDLSPYLIAVILAVGTAAVILGGIKRIASFATAVVPTMAVLYIIAGLIVVILNIGEVPAALVLIFQSAFGYDAAAGGIAVGALMLAMQNGVARGIFSNEAGQGTAPIAHAAANNNDPVNQGVIAMLGTVIDTLFVCTITGLAILTSGVLGTIDPGTGELLNGAPLTAAAFGEVLPGIGQYIVSFGLVIFGFTTILGWSYYGERCAEYLLGKRAVLPFRMSWIFFTFAGSAVLAGLSEYPIVKISWLAADTLTGLMAAPNLIALCLLSPIVFKVTKEYFAKK